MQSSQNSKRSILFLILFAFLILFVLLGGGAFLYKNAKHPFSPTVSLPQKPNVVVILVDTLRADRLPFYGYGADTAPFLTSLAAKSTVFEHAFSACSSTAPSIASVFTSLYPSEHGVVTGFVLRERLLKKSNEVELNRVPNGVATLAEEFKQFGYKTLGVSDNINISEQMGYTQGFDTFRSFQNKSGAAVNEEVLSWKDQLSSGDPYFLYIHYMDPHKPYLQRSPWFKPQKTRKETNSHAYDSEIRYVDEKISELFATYKWDENSIVIFLADHGEEFWDHGKEGHGMTLHTEVIRVPFFIYHPGYPGSRVSAAVHTMDILPSLADLVGFPHNDSWRGTSLVPALTGKELAPRVLYSELLRNQYDERPQRRSVIADGWHYIKQFPPERVAPDSSAELLYDLSTDFGEQVDKTAASTEKLEQLRALLTNFDEIVKTGKKESVTIPLNDDALNQLKSLGYLE